MKLALALAMLFPVAAAGAWLRLESPHFELYTNAGERDGRAALLRFEQIRHVFVEASAGQRVSPLPVRVFLFRGEKDFRPFRPGGATLGFYQSAPDRNYIAIQASGQETYRVAFHEYVHLVLNHSSSQLPRWLEEGTAEFYSTIEAAGGRLRIGVPIRNHLLLLAQREWIDATRLASVGRDSTEYNERDKAGLFYAQSWALVHMMYMSKDYRPRMPRLAAALDEGVPAVAAFRQAFGKSMAEAMAELRGYLSMGSLPVISLAWQGAPEGRISVRAITDEEALVAQLDLLLHLDRAPAARAMAERLRRQAGASPLLESVLGRLALAGGDNKSALVHFERAAEMGSREADLYFQRAMLLRDGGGSRPQVEEMLARTVALNPGHAEAHFLRGLMLELDGAFVEATGHYRRALRVLPRQSYFWHTLALACHKQGLNEEALDAARKALNCARTEPERERAYAAIHLVSAPPAAAPSTPRETVRSPSAWQSPKGDSRVEGILEHIDCLGPSARLQIRSQGKPVFLLVRDPGAVLLANASSLTFEFQCGAQAPRAVAAAYLARPDERLKTLGEVTAMEFR